MPLLGLAMQRDRSLEWTWKPWPACRALSALNQALALRIQPKNARRLRNSPANCRARALAHRIDLMPIFRLHRW
jgi:hypothetical protein